MSKPIYEKVIHNIRFYDHDPKAIHCIVYDNEAESLALARSDSSIEIWNCTEKPFRQYVICGKLGNTADALVWRKGRLFSGNLDGFIIEYDLFSLQPKTETAVTGGAVWCLSLSPDGTKIAAGTEEGYVCLFDITHGIQYQNILYKQESRVMSIAWQSDGSHIVTGSLDYVTLWSLQKGKISRFSVGRVTKERETIIWSVAVLDDLTIVTADSRGKCCFWNGNLGVLIDGIQSHKADILTMQVAEDQMSVVVAGVDPVIVQIDKVETRAKQGRPVAWVKSVHRQIHTHDVRALAITSQNRLFSGGVDTTLMQSYYPPKTCIKYPAMPHSGFASVAHEAHCILLAYPSNVQLWRFGNSEDSVSGPNGSYMTLAEDRVKLLQLHCRKKKTISWCAVCPDASYISYITAGEIKLFAFTLPMNGNPVAIKKLPEPSSEVELSKQILWITNDFLASLTHQGNIQILHVDENKVDVTKTMNVGSNRNIYLMTASRDGYYLATADNVGVSVYNLTKDTRIELPKKQCPITAMSIENELILVTYSDLSVIEYDLIKKKYTPFCRNLVQSTPPEWERRSLPTNNITYDLKNPEIIYLQDPHGMVIIKKIEDSNQNNNYYDTNNYYDGKRNYKRYKKERNSWNESSKSTQTTNKSAAFNFVNRSNVVLYQSEVKDNNIVSIEVNPITLEDKLPPPLKLKKFGV